MRNTIAVIALSSAFLSPAANAKTRYCQGLVVNVDMTIGEVADPSSTQDQVIRGTVGHDTIVGGHGNDTICARGGDDIVEGGPGDDLIRAGTGDDQISGGTGADQKPNARKCSKRVPSIAKRLI